MTESLFHVTLLRHGESTANAQGLLQGQADYALSERGIRQAQALAKYWQEQGRHFETIIASPLLRARQTGEIIAGALGAPLVTDPNWMERNAGKAAGMPLKDVDLRYPRDRFVHPYQAIAENGESQWELYLRAGHALNDLLRRSAGHYLVVSHGGILNQALYAILGIAPQPPAQGARFRFGNTGYAELVYDPLRHNWRMLSLNVQTHLNEADRDPIQGWGEQAPSQPGKKEKPDLEEVTIRQAVEEDLPDVMPILKQGDEHHSQALPHVFQEPDIPNVSQAYLMALLSSAENTIFVAKERGRVVGALIVTTRETPDVPIMVPRRFASIDNIVVDRAQRGRGIGRALMAHAHRWAREQGFQTVELNVWEFNKAARRLYLSLGYTVASRKMWKDLGDEAGNQNEPGSPT